MTLRGPTTEEPLATLANANWLMAGEPNFTVVIAETGINLSERTPHHD
jgi:hypothetical protein